MTTTVAKALRKAGGAIPTNRRIWDWLKEKGPKTGAEVSAALNIPISASSSIISQMKTRGMVRVETKHSEHLGRSVGYYAAVGRNFEILPIPKKDSASKFVPVLETTPVVTQESVKQTPDQILASISVADAFEIYKRLNVMFNKKTD